jgi:hypothetical protein
MKIKMFIHRVGNCRDPRAPLECRVNENQGEIRISPHELPVFRNRPNDAAQFAGMKGYWVPSC